MARFDAVRRSAGSVSIVTGDAEVVLAQAPFSMSVQDRTGPVVTSVPSAGPFLVRNGTRHAVATSRVVRASNRSVVLDVGFDDRSTGTLQLSPATGGSIRVALRAGDSSGVTGWGDVLGLAADEAIYGLTERIVDDRTASEIVPVEAGSLDRRGERVSMWVTPTMSGYAPFHQSSRRYGLLVDGTMPGVYDVGRADPGRLDLQFEVAPGSAGGSFHLFLGDHARILDQYTALTGRAPVPPPVVFRHWRGRDEEPVGPPATWHGIDINASVAADLTAYEQAGIPAGIYHFDRPWAVGTQGYGDFRFDPVRFPNAASMLREMRRSGWRVEVWVSPWVLDAAGAQARANGWLAPRSDRSLDLTNPHAVAWQQNRLLTFLHGPEGRFVDGLFLDRGDESDVSSEASDVYADGRTGREIHNAYPVLYARTYRTALEWARPDGDGFLMARPAYTGTQALAMRWGGDTPSREGITIPEVPNTGPSTDLGLRSVLISMQRAAFMGTPYWGSDIGGYSPWIDRDLYARWMEVGSVSPLMRFHGQGGTPWSVTGDGSSDPELLGIYRRYVRLHHALTPYLERLAREANRTGMTLVRPLVFTWPGLPAAQNRWDEWTLGPDLLAAPVWRSGQRSRSVWIPPGEWVDTADRSRVVRGPAEITVDAPLATLPLFARRGSAVDHLLSRRVPG
jgi:alpha-D-xyloside xylohydrolase